MLYEENLEVIKQQDKYVEKVKKLINNYKEKKEKEKLKEKNK